MKELMVKTPLQSYPIVIQSGFEGLCTVVKNAGLNGRKLCIITDDTVAKFYLEQVKKVLEAVFSEISCVVFSAGEKSKNLDTIQAFYRFFLEQRLDRGSVIAGLGGGVCGDMAGFAAASFMRGLPFIQIPTTLLAQVDSSVGGKVGVDFMGVKNIVGAFYQPKFVYINTDTLHTLPKREFSAGMAEVIKYGLIVSRDFYQTLTEKKEKIMQKDADVLEEIIVSCCAFKAEVVSEDEREAGRRAILNFGHTIGHAIEALQEFRLVHGECVGIGMVAALTLCVNRGLLAEKEREDCEHLLQYYEVPIRTSGLEADAIYDKLFSDKKVSQNKINYVLLEKIGDSFLTSDISRKEVLDAISYIL